MSITPTDIQNQRFSEARRGYDPGEVDEFLDKLAVEVEAMLHKIADLKGRLNTAEDKLKDAQSDSFATQENALFQPAPQPSKGTAEEIGSVLIVAQQTADQIVADAEKRAGVIQSEAESRSREVVSQALREKEDELREIARLKESREKFRVEYLDLLEHFKNEAKAEFPDTLLSSSQMTGLESYSGEPEVSPVVKSESKFNEIHEIVEIDEIDIDDLD